LKKVKVEWCGGTRTTRGMLASTCTIGYVHALSHVPTPTYDTRHTTHARTTFHTNTRTHVVPGMLTRRQVRWSKCRHGTRWCYRPVWWDRQSLICRFFVSFTFHSHSCVLPSSVPEPYLVFSLNCNIVEGLSHSLESTLSSLVVRRAPQHIIGSELQPTCTLPRAVRFANILPLKHTIRNESQVEMESQIQNQSQIQNESQMQNESQLQNESQMQNESQLQNRVSLLNSKLPHPRPVLLLVSGVGDAEQLESVSFCGSLSFGGNLLLFCPFLLLFLD
jgi:hypothetical protein